MTLPPLLLGVIAKTKALFAGRVGPPLLQPYYDLIKLFQKGSVFSTTTTWVFRAGPVVGLVTAAIAVLLIPLANATRADLVHRRPDSAGVPARPGPVLHGLGGPGHRLRRSRGWGRRGKSPSPAWRNRRSSWGCSSWPSCPGRCNWRACSAARSASHWPTAGASLALVLLSWFIVLLAENSRIPFDDPNTHLELTMIHEVMVLDHSGPAFGMILYGAALKLFVFGALVVRLAFPCGDGLSVAGLAHLRRGDAGRRGGDRRRGIDHGAPAADARSDPPRRGLPAVGLWHHPAGEVNRWSSFSIPC